MLATIIMFMNIAAFVALALLTLVSAAPPSLPDYHCQQAFHKDTSPLTGQACPSAILKLPNDHHLGKFHYGEPNDGYRLTQSAISRGCRVKISMLSIDAAEQTNWADVVLTAALLNGVCGNHWAHRRFLSGTVVKGNLRITLQAVAVELSGNGTLQSIGTDIE